MNMKSRHWKKAIKALWLSPRAWGAAILAAWLVGPGAVQARDEERVATPPALETLEWMVGSWIHDSEGAVMTMTAHWSEDRQSLHREFEIKLGGLEVMRVQQVLYWDPVTKKLMSKGTTSDGVTENGELRMDGKRLQNNCQITFPDGRRGSAVNIWQLDEFNQCVFTSTQRLVDGENRSDIAPTEFGALATGAGWQDRVAVAVP